MLNCRIFTSPKFGEIRTTKDGDGTPLFIARDIAKVLFQSGTDRVINQYCKHVVQVPNPTCPKRKIYAIGLPDVSRMTVKSKSQFTVDFHDWIYDEVLPELRSTSFVESKTNQPDSNNDKKDMDGQEQVRNDKKISESELILKLAQMNLDNEKRIIALEKHVEEAIDCFSYSKDIDQYYSTIAGYIQRFKLPILVNQYASYGSRAQSICKRRGVEISKLSDVRYGTINLYPNYILQELFKDYFSK